MHVGSGSFMLYNAKLLLETIIGQVQVGFFAFTLILCMPSFSFISGFFSTPNMNKGQRTNLVRYVATWVIQHTFASLMGLQQEYNMRKIAWEKEHPDLNATNAALQAEGKPTLSPPGVWPLHIFRCIGLDWYLWCVIIWRCLLPLIAQLRYPLIVSIVLGVTVMFTDASSNEYTNTPFGFMPFFVLGFLAKDRKQEMKDLRKNNVAKGLFLLVAVVIICAPVVDVDEVVFMAISRNLGCIYGGQVANMLHVPLTNQLNVTKMFNEPIPVTHYCQSSAALAQVPIFYAAGMCVILGFMTVVPVDRKGILTWAGANSIYIYFGQLWGMILVMRIAGYLMMSGVVLPPLVGTLIMIPCVFVVWMLFAQPCFKCFCCPCIEPKVERGCLSIVRTEELT